MTSPGERVALAAFVTQAVLAGGNAVGIRFSNRELAPLWGAGLRFSLAAALLLIVMAVLRLPFPRGRALTGSVLYGLFNFGLSFALIYYGLVRVQAGLGQILSRSCRLPRCCSRCCGGRNACGARPSSAASSRLSGSP